MITDALMDVVKRGTAAKAAGALGKYVAFAGKTGTTKDGWFVGYTPNLVTVAWVGLDDNEDLHTTGGDIALPLWVDFMRNVVQLRPEYGGASFAMPKGLVEVVIDPETGMAAGPYCPQRETAIVPTSAATFVHCFKHEPLETMYAMADVHETDAYPTTIEANTVNIDPALIQKATRPAVDYEEVSDDNERLNIRRPSTRTDEQQVQPPDKIKNPE